MSDKVVIFVLAILASGYASQYTEANRSIEMKKIECDQRLNKSITPP